MMYFWKLWRPLLPGSWKKITPLYLRGIPAVVICAGCQDCLREMDEYVWDLSSGSGDQVKKEHDHAMDDMRYFVSTVLGERETGFVACTVERRR